MKGKYIILLLALAVSTPALATSISVECIAGHQYVIVTSGSGIAIVQSFHEGSGWDAPQAVKC